MEDGEPRADLVREAEQVELAAEAAVVAAQEKMADASAQSAASAEAERQASTAATDKPVTYAELQGKVLALHKADATAAKPIAEAMGFANFKAMPDDKWPEALRRVQTPQAFRYAAILAAHRALCTLLPDQHPLLVLVPRHPQRFNDIATLILREGFQLARRSDGLPRTETDVWLGDSMGEMVAYYSLADVAVIGGTLLPFGGQNLIEAAACGTPLIIGPHTYNFSAAANDAEQTGAAIRLETVTPDTLATALHVLITNPSQYQAAQEATEKFVSGATGATDKLLRLITQYSRP